MDSPLYHSPRTGPWVAWVPPPACGRQLQESQQGSLGLHLLWSTPGENNSPEPITSQSWLIIRYSLQSDLACLWCITMPAVLKLSEAMQFKWRDFLSANTDLVQRPYRNRGDVVGDELPGRALRVAGGEALSVPQVTYMKMKRVYLIRIRYLQFCKVF